MNQDTIDKAVDFYNTLWRRMGLNVDWMGKKVENPPTSQKSDEKDKKSIDIDDVPDTKDVGELPELEGLALSQLQILAGQEKQRETNNFNAWLQCRNAEVNNKFYLLYKLYQSRVALIHAEIERRIA